MALFYVSTFSYWKITLMFVLEMGQIGGAILLNLLEIIHFSTACYKNRGLFLKTEEDVSSMNMF